MKRFFAMLIATSMLLGISTPILSQAQVSIDFPTFNHATTTPKKKIIDLSCMQAAVSKRETAVINAYDTYSTAITATLQTRKSALVAAWTITDTKQRWTAIMKAWTTFWKDRKAARQTFRMTRNAAWKQFKIDRKACGAGPTGEDPGSELDV